MSDQKTFFERIYDEHADLLPQVLEQCGTEIDAAGQTIVETLQNGGTIFICGNGGSAGDSQHFAAELVGRFEDKKRGGLPAIALTVDSSALTSISNDFGYEQVFSRQIEALARPGDLLIGISTSGRSGNVLAAMEKAFAIGAQCIGLAGQDRSAMAPFSKHVVSIPSPKTARVQEMHIMVIHAWCGMVDGAFGGSGE